MLPDPVNRFLDAPRHSGLTVRRQLAVFALYLVLAVVYTWPLAFSLTTHIPGAEGVIDIREDSALQSWYPWWVRKALTGPESLLYTDHVFYPVGMELTMQPAMFLHGAMTVPLWWMDITTANNVVILVSFALSGLAGCLLGYYVCKSLPGALFCGFVFAFSPYRFQHIEGHYQLMATETLPLVALSLIRLWDTPSRRNIAWAGIWLGLTIYTDYYYFAYALLLVGFLFLWRLWTDPDRTGVIRRTVLSGLVALLVSGPLLVPAIRSAARSDYAIATGHEKHKADLFSPFIPSERQVVGLLLWPLLDGIFDKEKVDGVEHSIYLGWPILILVAAFSGELRRRVPHASAFVAAAGVFVVFAFGPLLSINGVERFGEAGRAIPMPGLLLVDAPVFEGARAPSRIFVLTVVSLSVLAGAALTRLLERETVRGVAAKRIAVAVVAVTALEFAFPIRLADIRPNPGVAAIAQDPAPGTVVDIPSVPSKTPFWQPLWDRKMTLVSLGRADPGLMQYYWRHDATRMLVLPDYVTHIAPREESEYAMDLLSIRYALVDRTVYAKKPDRLDRLKSILETHYGMVETFRDSTASVYRLERDFRAASNLVFDTMLSQADLHLAYGWSNRVPHEDVVIAWMEKRRALIVVPAMQPGAYELRLTLWVLAEQPQHVRFRIGTHEIERELPPGRQILTVPVPEGTFTDTGANLIELRPSGTVGLPHTTGLRVHRDPDARPIEVISGGFFTHGVGSAAIIVDGKRLTTYDRGMFVAIVEENGAVKTDQFQSVNPEVTVDQMEAFIKSAPESATIAIASRNINRLFGGNLGRAFRHVGFPEELTLNPLNSFAVIGYLDGRLPELNTGASLATVAVGRQPRTNDASVGLLSLELDQR